MRYPKHTLLIWLLDFLRKYPSVGKNRILGCKFATGLFLLIVHCALTAQQKPITEPWGNSAKLDSLNRLLNVLPDDSVKVKVYKSICWEMRALDMKKALAYGMQGLKLAQKINYPKGEADLGRYIGIIYRHNLMNAEAVEWFIKALKLSERINDQEGIGFCYDNIGVVYFYWGQYFKSLQYFQKATDVFRAISNQKGLGYAYTHCTWVYREKKEFDLALRYGKLTVEIRKKSKEPALIDNAYRDLASVYFSMKDYTEAQKYMDMSYYSATRRNDEVSLSDFAYHMSILRYSMGNLPEAEKFGLQGLRLAQKLNHKRQIMNSVKNLGDIAKAQGNIPQAFEYMETYLAYHDTLQNEDVTQKTAELEARYRFEKEEQRIIAEQDRRLANQRFWTTVAISAFLFMVVVAYLIYRSERNKEAANRLLEKKNIELARTNHTKDKFFSLIAHDLKNPFHNIIGLADLLSENIRKYDINKSELYAQSIKASASDTYVLLENLLDWASIQRGEIQFLPVKLNLRDLFVQKVRRQQVAVEKKLINLRIADMSPNIEVIADNNMLMTVLRNLLTNAIKFTNFGGEVTLNAIIEGNMAKVEVADTGIGMDAKQLQGLFDIETRTSRLGTANEKGSGLGLSLCKEFVERNGGKIWVESEPGLGTHFYFTVPLASS